MNATFHNNLTSSITQSLVLVLIPYS
jgi:hypothetical protein